MDVRKKRNQLRARDGDRCCYCEVVMTFTTRALARNYKFSATIEHVKRRADGGTNELINLKLACKDCNSGRGTHSHEYWRFIRKPGNG